MKVALPSILTMYTTAKEIARKKLLLRQCTWLNPEKNIYYIFDCSNVHSQIQKKMTVAMSIFLKIIFLLCLPTLLLRADDS